MKIKIYINNYIEKKIIIRSEVKLKKIKYFLFIIIIKILIRYIVYNLNIFKIKIKGKALKIIIYINNITIIV